MSNLPWDNDTIIGDAPPKAAASTLPWANDKIVGDASSPSVAGYAADIAKAVPSGLVRGANYLAGGASDLMNLLDKGWQYGSSKALEKVGAITPEQAAGMRQPIPGLEDTGQRFDVMGVGLPTSKTLNRGVEAVTGPLYKPQTLPGEYANTIAEFAPGMVLGGGSLPQRIMQTAVPAITSETAGQVARQTVPELEPAARVGGALLGAGGVAAGQTPRGPEAMVGKALTGADTAAVQRAEALIQDAATQGVRLTWDEAIQHVTNGATRLSDLRRVVENSRGGGDVIKPLMAERPGQVRAAGDSAIGGIAPNRMDPIEAGRAAQTAADRAVIDTQGDINKATRPYYQAAGSQNVGPSDYHPLAADPLYSKALSEVRSDPALNRTVENLPDDSVAVVDLVQRRLREMSDNARVPGQAHTSNLMASNFDDARTGAVKAAEGATGGPTGSYGTARLGQALLRDQFLAPLTEGPVGKVAGTNDILAQGRAILPDAPAPGSAAASADAVTRLAARHPDAASNLVHARIRSVFDEATQNIQSGPNQWGGANFAAKIAGNSQQAQNLEGTIRALPNGDARWDGFRRFLDVMEATGKRPQQGSATAFNQAEQQALKGGNAIRTGSEIAATGGTAVLRRIKDFYEQVNMGRNTEQIANILTNPSSGRLLERLASEPPNSQRAAILALRLSYMGRSAARGAQSESQPSN